MGKPGFVERGRELAEDFIRHGVETWHSEGHLDRAQADGLIGTLNAPEVEAGMLHLGAHFAISLPLRFPFGAGARFFYTLGLRVRAEAGAILRRGSAREARRMHTFLVMLVSLLPGFGRLGYFFSPALREERLLLVIPLDQASRKLPFRAYSRLHLDALFLYWGLGDKEEKQLRALDRRSLRELGARLAALKPLFKPTAALIAADTVVLLIGAFLYLDAERPRELWWWREGGLIATLDAGQLLAASVFGIAAYLTFWDRRPDAPRSEAAGIFFWVIGAVGVATFAFDDYFTVHERLGNWLLEQMQFVPILTDASGDMLILGYAVGGVATLIFFRMEILSGRPSATLLQLAAITAVVMVVVDGFGTTDAIKALEFPTQTFACTLLMMAFLVRWLEVRQPAQARERLEFREAKT